MSNSRNIIITSMLVVFAQPAFSLDTFSQDCINTAARHYNVNEKLVTAIAMVESTNCNQNAFNYNARDKSTDYGCMQVNSWWKPHLKKHGIEYSDVKKDKCLNIAVGVWILKQSIITAKGDIWLGVGAYNAGFKQSRERARVKYAWKVFNKYKEIGNS